MTITDEMVERAANRIRGFVLPTSKLTLAMPQYDAELLARAALESALNGTEDK